jgi:hypothetical protein
MSTPYAHAAKARDPHAIPVLHALMLGLVLALGAGTIAFAMDVPQKRGIAACSDAIDNDGDGLVDLASPYCKLPEDPDESSFLGGPGDDMNTPAGLDCWFDLNSGSGDDDCSIHACCMIDGPCPAELDPASFDPGACSVSETCVSACQPPATAYRPARCDCFGCCGFCDADGENCVDLFVNPAVSPECSLDNLDDPSKCRSCSPHPACKALPVAVFGDGFEPSSSRGGPPPAPASAPMCSTRSPT